MRGFAKNKKLHKILSKAYKKRITEQEIYREMGISRSYFSKIKSGVIPLTNVMEVRIKEVVERGKDESN